MTEADSRIVVIPPSWWSIVLVGMNLPADHPAIQVKAHKKDVPDNWRTQRVGKGKLAASAFDSAIRAGRREVEEARPRMIPGTNLAYWEQSCRAAAREREGQLALWMVSWDEVPYLVRRQGHNWLNERILIRDLRKMDIEPECWEFDDEFLDRIPTPREQKVAA